MSVQLHSLGLSEDVLESPVVGFSFMAPIAFTTQPQWNTFATVWSTEAWACSICDS